MATVLVVTPKSVMVVSKVFLRETVCTVWGSLRHRPLNTSAAEVLLRIG